MRIINILKDCIAPLSGNPLLHDGAKWLQNIIADSVNLPAVFLDHPIRLRFIRSGSGRRERYFPVLLFCEQSKPTFTQEQHNVIIERQRKQAEQFIINLEAHPDVETIEGEPEVVGVMNFLDVGVTGVTVTLQLLLRFEYPFYCPQPIIEPLVNPSIISTSVSVLNQNFSGKIFILGTGFQDGAVVSVNGSGFTIDEFIFVDTENINCEFFLNDALLGTRNLTVTNPDGGTFTLENAFTIVPDAD